jgi:hypothetical protein
MEILQIVAGPLPDSMLAQDFVVPTAFAAPMDFGQIFEEEAGAVKQRQQRSVMIGRKWVDAGFYVGEVLPEKNGHVRIKASAIRHGRISVGALPSGSTVPSPRRLRKSAHGEAVPDIPGDAWQLASAAGDAYGDAGEWIAHGSFPAAKLAYI